MVNYHLFNHVQALGDQCQSGDASSKSNWDASLGTNSDPENSTTDDESTSATQLFTFMNGQPRLILSSLPWYSCQYQCKPDLHISSPLVTLVLTDLTSSWGTPTSIRDAYLLVPIEVPKPLQLLQLIVTYLLRTLLLRHYYSLCHTNCHLMFILLSQSCTPQCCFKSSCLSSMFDCMRQSESMYDGCSSVIKALEVQVGTLSSIPNRVWSQPESGKR